MTNSKILVVDDEPTIRSFLVRVLVHEGYEVEAACDGDEALQFLETMPFDLLLTDIKMENMDGVVLLHEAKARYPDLTVILLTGHATVSSAVAALRQGAYDYLLKPVKNEQIVTAVATGLEERARQQRRDYLEQIAAQMVDVMQPEPSVHASTRPGGAKAHMVTCGALQLDATSYKATLYGKVLELTPTEFRLLLELSREPGAVLNYVKLVQMACGYTCARHEAREIIGTHVINLRQKLGTEPDQPLYVESVRGIGYRLIPPNEDVSE